MTRIARWLIPTFAVLVMLLGAFGIASAEENRPTPGQPGETKPTPTQPSEGKPTPPPSEGKPTPPPSEGKPALPPAKAAELERLYRLEQLQLRSLAEFLTRDERRGGEISGLIARAKAEGKDTAALEQALASYKEKLNSARSAWQTAAAALKAHAGFSDAGRATNLDQARATLKTAGSALELSYKTARSAEELLNKALMALRSHK